MFRFMAGQPKQPRRRTSRHGHPRGFDKSMPTEMPDPLGWRDRDDNEHYAEDHDDQGGEEWL
jgi:hypothetical protein